MKRIRRNRRKDEPEDETPETPGWGMMGLWGAMFLLVVMVIFNIVPISQGISPLRSRKEKKLMQSAEALTKEENWSAAEEIYETLLEDSRASTKSRVEAALILHDLYKDRLASPGRALDAIRDAYLLERDTTRHEELKQRWRDYAALVGTLDRPHGVPPGATVIAEIGDDQVTLEEILLSWKRQNADTPLTAEVMAKYVQDYMTNSLLAEGARRRGMAKTPMIMFDLRNFERGALSREIQVSLHKQADPAAVEAHYKEHLNKYKAPDAISLQHIIVRTEDAVSSVSQQLAAGEDFAAIALTASLDGEALPNGCELGSMSTEDDFVPNVGIIPGFASRIAMKDEGYTTGPITTARGTHWFRLQQKKVDQPYPLEEIRERVERDERKETFDSARQALIEELKKSIPMKLHEDRLKAALEKIKPANEGTSEPATSPATP